MLHQRSPEVASALIAGVLPVLAQAIQEAGESLAIELADGQKVNIRHRTQAQQLLMFALADYLEDVDHGREEDDLYPPLRPYELADLDYARQWFAERSDPDGTIDEDAVPPDDGDTLPVQTVTDVTPGPKPVRSTYGVSNDTDLTEEGIAQGVIYPFVKKQLDSISEALAGSYAPMHVEDGKAVYDLVAGAKAARRAVLMSFLSWLQVDPALQDDGAEIAILL